jgi:hypothetical protein
MRQCSIQLCAICMKTDKLCAGSNTIFQILVSADAPGISIPVTRPQTSERSRQGFRLPCRDQFAWLALARCSSAAHACAMFSVDETTAEAIRQVFEADSYLRSRRTESIAPVATAAR